MTLSDEDKKWIRNEMERIAWNAVKKNEDPDFEPETEEDGTTK